MAQQQQDTTITGEVEAVNERGVKVNGAWLNFSKFADVPRPEAGQTVAVTVRGDRWVQGLRVLTPGALDELEGAEAGPDFGDFSEAPPVDDDDPGTWGYGSGSGKGSAAPRPIRQAAPAPPTGDAFRAQAKAPGRATLKAAALAAAAHFHSGRAGEEGAEGDVYEMAFRFLAWLEDGDA
jgi:hypothetical protein